MATSFSTSGLKEIGDLKKLMVEWRIADFFSIVEDKNYYRYASPTFSFAKAQWHLRLWPKWTDAPEFMSVYLLRNTGDGMTVEYHLGLKKSNGDVEQLIGGTLETETFISMEGLIRKAELLQRKSEFAPYDILTVTCVIKRINEPTSSNQDTLLDQAKQLKLISK